MLRLFKYFELRKLVANGAYGLLNLLHFLQFEPLSGPAHDVAVHSLREPRGRLAELFCNGFGLDNLQNRLDALAEKFQSRRFRKVMDSGLIHFSKFLAMICYKLGKLVKDSFLVLVAPCLDIFRAKFYVIFLFFY